MVISGTIMVIRWYVTGFLPTTRLWFKGLPNQHLSNKLLLTIRSLRKRSNGQEENDKY